MAQAPAKLWGGQGLHPAIEAYTVGDDYLIDQRLVPFDVDGCRAHAGMLREMGLLSAAEKNRLDAALAEVKELWKAGEFTVNVSQEDCHTAIEQYISDKYGEVGKKLHTGRSRNDQSLVMCRLFAKSRLADIKEQVTRTGKCFRARAATAGDTPMPGYTHMQRAMPTTVGRWLSSFADAFDDSVLQVEAAERLLDQNPLGSAAGFGIRNLQLDRSVTTKALGFAKTQENPLYCGLSRGLFESTVLHNLALPMTLCSRFAVDMMMFTQQETAYFSLGDAFVTGSSIMPQKKNYDLFEIMRANGRVYLSYSAQIQDIILGLGSGYHRDLQLTKRALVLALDLLKETLGVLELAVPELVVHAPQLEAAMGPELFITENVYELVAGGTPFRDAYARVKRQWNEDRDATAAKRAKQD